jgi:hypothetical protein
VGHCGKEFSLFADIYIFFNIKENVKSDTSDVSSGLHTEYLANSWWWNLLLYLGNACKHFLS